ncbi:MAG: permease [Myxococcota bacterium]|nr:permease [Myxococcota bacterium]
MLSVQFTLLLAALAGLLFGPVLLQIRRDVGPWQKALDGFTMVAVGGLAAFHLIPEAIEHGGFATLFFGGFGALLPLWSHHYAERLGGRGEILILMLGLIPHAALESAALGLADNTQALGLGIAVAAHRLPVGLLIFFLVRHRLGTKQAWIAIAILMLATLGGFVGGETFSTSLSGFGFAAFQALVAGSLLHVAFSHRLLAEGEHDAGCGHAAPKTQNAQEEHHHDHGHDHTHSASAETIWAGLGALLGACVLIFTLSFGHQHAEHGQNGQHFTETFLSLSLKSAPALLLAYFLAGLIGILITPARAQWLAAGHQSIQALKGVAFGLPMPICSCGILPIYESLIKRGVPAVAAIGFLVATPELGIDAILISIPLLGQEMTLARLAAAFFVALGAALIVGPMVKNPTPCPTHTASPTPQTLKTRLKAGLKFGLVELFDHTMPWIYCGAVDCRLGRTLVGTSMAPANSILPASASFCTHGHSRLCLRLRCHPHCRHRDLSRHQPRSWSGLSPGWSRNQYDHLRYFKSHSHQKGGPRLWPCGDPCCHRGRLDYRCASYRGEG